MAGCSKRSHATADDSVSARHRPAERPANATAKPGGCTNRPTPITSRGPTKPNESVSGAPATPAIGSGPRSRPIRPATAERRGRKRGRRRGRFLILYNLCLTFSGGTIDGSDRKKGSVLVRLPRVPIARHSAIHPTVIVVSAHKRALICVSNSSRNFSSPRHQPRRIGLNSSPSYAPRRSSNARSSRCRPAGLSSGMPHSPSNRSTRNNAGRFEGASKFTGQLLQAKLSKGASATTSFARAGFKWT